MASRKLREPTNRQAPVRVGQIFATYRRPAFIALCVVTAAYNFVFFVVLGYTPLFLGLDVIPLGLAFTGWGLGLAAGIMLIGHRLAHRIGAVQTVGVALVGLLVCMVLFATSSSTAEALVVLVLAGLCMGLANANLTDLAPRPRLQPTAASPPARSTWSAGGPPRRHRSSPASSPSTVAGAAVLGRLRGARRRCARSTWPSPT